MKTTREFPANLFSSSGEKIYKTTEDLDLLMRPEQRQRTFEERYRPFLLEFDALELLTSQKDALWNWEKDRILETGFQSRTKNRCPRAFQS